MLSAAFVELDFEQLSRSESVQGSIYRCPFGDLTFLRSVTEGGAHRVTRSEHLIHASKHDNFIYRLSARWQRAAVDIAILDSTRVYTIDVPSSFEAFWVHTPKRRR